MVDKSYWGTTRKALLVLEFSSLDGIHEYRNAIKAVDLNVNDCVILALVATKQERQMLTEFHSVFYASEQEINILGRWKNEEALKVLARHYDMMIVIGDHSNKILKQIKKVKSRISVGINTEADFLTINLISEQKSPEHLLNFAKQTLEKTK